MAKKGYFTVEVGATSILYVIAGFIAGHYLAKRKYNVYYDEGGE